MKTISKNRLAFYNSEIKKKESLGEIHLVNNMPFDVEDIEKVIDSLPVVPNTLRVTREDLTEMPDLLIQSQPLFKRTGAAHARRFSFIISICPRLRLRQSLPPCLLLP